MDYVNCEVRDLKVIDDVIRCKLMEKALSIRENAYAPYSNFKVGAAVLFEEGSVITGCNVENASYGLSICAERNALTQAVSLGFRNPIAIAVAGEDKKECPPCGACRQFLAEFNPNMEVILQNGNELVIYCLDSLLPHRFNIML